MRHRVPLLLALFCAAAMAAAAPRACVGSVPIATFQIRVTPPTGSAGPLPIRQVNTLAKGYRVICSPTKLPPDMKNNARMTLVAVPATTAGGDGVTVLDPRGVEGPNEWIMPFPVSVLVLVFGPQGLDEKRVAKLVSRDDDLVSELATYANQTEDLEDTIDTLAVVEDSPEDDLADSSAGRTGSGTDQVLFALTRALNPVLAAYNPLGAGKKAGPTTNMGKAADTFFENAGGVVPGGGALPAVKSFLMPDTEFRTVYTEPVTGGLTLCAQRKLTNSRNRFVYLWAHRLVNSGPPAVTLSRPAWLPIGTRSTVAVKVKADEWPLLDRVREWTLAGAAGQPTPVKVRSDQRRSIELDLRKTTLEPGVYRLEGKWDWGAVHVAGEFHLAGLCDGTKVRTNPESQGTLVDGRGVVSLRLEGSDFEFVERASLRKEGRLGVLPADLEYVLPIGPRAGPQQSIDVDIDTNRFHAGAYQLALAQTGGATQNVPVRVLPTMPKIENLPLRINTGAKDLRLLLKGTGLDKIEGLAAEHATFRLGAGGSDEREVFVTLDGSAQKGDKLALQLGVGGVAEAGRIPNAIAVAGPRPRIAGLKLSPPDDLGAALREGELPAGSFAGMTLQVENVEGLAALRLECADSANALGTLRVRAGEKLATARLDAPAPGSLYARFDAGAVGTPGCMLQAAVDTEAAGVSDPAPVGRVVRLPRIESLTLTNEKVDQGYAAILKGWDLETIEKAGWDASNGLAVPAPPRNAAGEGDRQTLRITVPWPSPAPMSPLFIWLRGDKDGRAASRGK